MSIDHILHGRLHPELALMLQWPWSMAGMNWFPNKVIGTRGGLAYRIEPISPSVSTSQTQHLAALRGVRVTLFMGAGGTTMTEDFFLHDYMDQQTAGSTITIGRKGEVALSLRQSSGTTTIPITRQRLQPICEAIEGFLTIFAQVAGPIVMSVAGDALRANPAVTSSKSSTPARAAASSEGDEQQDFLALGEEEMVFVVDDDHAALTGRRP